MIKNLHLNNVAKPKATIPRMNQAPKKWQMKTLGVNRNHKYSKYANVKIFE